LNRSFGISVVFTALGLVACNAILGNEPEYRLVSGEAGEAGTSRSGSGGSGGRPGAGGSTQGGTAGDAGGSELPAAGSSYEPGGSTSTGGAPSTGGRSGEAGEGNAPGATGGSAGEPNGGMTGTGGADSCEPSGEEQCFNSIDDDCNGAVDCEDEACGSATRCVEVPRGAIFGDFDPASCAPGVTSIRLYQGLTSATECDGCSCTPTTSDCDAGIYNFGAKTCPGFDFQPGLQNTFASSCQPLGGDTKIHYYSIRGVTNCQASGTPRLPSVSWAAESSFCPDERAGAGCGSNSACIPDDGPRCVLLEGANASCPSGYTRDATGAWYTGYSDQRACSECYCGFVTGACTGARLEVYSMFGCGGTSLVVSNGEEGDNCALPFGAASARIIGTADPMNCPPQSYADDKLSATGARTLCCR